LKLTEIQPKSMQPDLQNGQISARAESRYSPFSQLINVLTMQVLSKWCNLATPISTSAQNAECTV